MQSVLIITNLPYGIALGFFCSVLALSSTCLASSVGLRVVNAFIRKLSILGRP